MRFTSSLFFLASSGMLANAAPLASDDDMPAVSEGRPEMRLIKTSAADPGRWVTAEEKDALAAGRVGFVDVTGVSAEELAVLSTPDAAAQEEAAALVARQSVTYPTSLTHQTEATQLSSQVGTTNPQTWLKGLTDFTTRHYRTTTGTSSGVWLQGQLRTLISSRSGATVTTVTHSFNQPSIIVRIPGQSSNLVIVGSHFDSTGGSQTARGPGAEDDGSGVVVLMEALRVIASSSFQPKNTLEFHFYAGEEGGLLGSRDVFANYRSAGRRVMAMLNQDMAGYSPSGRLTVYTDFVDTPLTAYVRLIAQASAGVAPLSSTCGYGCSDHASARSNGFPAAYVGDEPFATSASFIHSPNDTYDKIQWPTIQRHAKFITNFLVEASYL